MKNLTGKLALAFLMASALSMPASAAPPARPAAGHPAAHVGGGTPHMGGGVPHFNGGARAAFHAPARSFTPHASARSFTPHVSGRSFTSHVGKHLIINTSTAARRTSPTSIAARRSTAPLCTRSGTVRKQSGHIAG